LNSQYGLQKLIESLHPLYQEDALFFSKVKNRWMSETDNNLFWYLSSGLDLFPLSHFVTARKGFPKAGFFLYTDIADVSFTLKQNLDAYNSPVEIPGTGLFLDRFTELRSALLKARFSYLEFLTLEGKRIPLLLCQSSNREMLSTFQETGVRAKYLCTVTDGCRSEDKEIRNNCPVNSYEEFATVLDGGYWISDHLPDKAAPFFRKAGIIEGWGRYNLFDETYIYEIEN